MYYIIVYGIILCYVMLCYIILHYNVTYYNYQSNITLNLLYPLQTASPSITITVSKTEVDSAIAGCMDESACNYNPNASSDDGSCIFIDGICETCIDGIIIDNDQDNDGICNELEIIGCLEPMACNYNSNATDEGECIYQDFSSCEICSGEADGTGIIIEYDNDNDGLTSVDDGYEIRTDKIDAAGEMCPRQNETSGEDLYVIEFFDVWADAYVSEPNQALPGFSAIFALFSLLGISLFRRRK